MFGFNFSNFLMSGPKCSPSDPIAQKVTTFSLPLEAEHDANRRAPEERMISPSKVANAFLKYLGQKPTSRLVRLISLKDNCLSINNPGFFQYSNSTLAGSSSIWTLFPSRTGTGMPFTFAERTGLLHGDSTRTCACERSMPPESEYSTMPS